MEKLGLQSGFSEFTSSTVRHPISISQFHLVHKHSLTMQFMPGWPGPGYSACGPWTSLSASLQSLFEMQNLGPLAGLTESESAFPQDPQVLQMCLQV